MTSFEFSGSFDRTETFLKTASKYNILSLLNSYGREGVTALANATPVDTGMAAHSWTYEVTGSNGSYEISWLNTNIENGFPVVIMLQYGHGTGTGGLITGNSATTVNIAGISLGTFSYRAQPTNGSGYTGASTGYYIARGPVD